MKRLLQGLALLQLFLLIALGVRTVRVWTTPLPEFSEIPELPATTPIPPPKGVPKVSETVTNDIVQNDLFDDQRGKGAEENPADVEVEQPPVPPPTSIKLMGVMMLGGEPIGILLDPSVKPDQQSVRKGDMFGDYQVGDITSTGLVLLGTGTPSQQFQIPLHVETAGGGGGPPAPGAPPPPPGRPVAATRPGAPNKPVSARPVPPGGAAAPEQKVMSARERAQAIAQRNAEARKNPGKGGANAAAEEGQKQGGAPDPVQARLEALRQLREAAKGR